MEKYTLYKGKVMSVEDAEWCHYYDSGEDKIDEQLIAELEELGDDDD